jgi:glycosidase
MVWTDLEYETERTHPFGLERDPDPVAPDLSLFDTYRELVRLRKDHLRLFVDGTVRWLEASDANRTLAYERSLDGDRAIVAFNASEDYMELELEAEDGTWRVAFSSAGTSPEAVQVTNGVLTVELPPLSARVWIRN